MADIGKWYGVLEKWYPGEDDPITQDQIKSLVSILGDRITDDSFEGFLIVCSRFVDEFGTHRTNDLASIFLTDSEAGKVCLLKSLEHVKSWVGGMQVYLDKYPVSIRPPRPAFPQFKIVGLESIVDNVYRVMSTTARLMTKESFKDFIVRTGMLPNTRRRSHPVMRSKRRRVHWCSYETWETPEATRDALQILPDWGNDCQLRATLPTVGIRDSAFVAFNADTDESGKGLRFVKYFNEMLATDHPPLLGGGTQITVEGSPLVSVLEQWDADLKQWRVIWSRHK
ncbi:MAG TPA: hypothetical protein VJB57_17025 [Dehalococcoidia bacterium]|nr:hypothetical protein [Dehalococcoidia bacterium]